jgi:hypothetical protein
MVMNNYFKTIRMEPVMEYSYLKEFPNFAWGA